MRTQSEKLMSWLEGNAKDGIVDIAPGIVARLGDAGQVRLSVSVDVPAGSDIAQTVERISEALSGEIRFCDECGGPMLDGIMDSTGFWHCCEACFGKAMDRDYPQGWYALVDEPNDYDGFYNAIVDGKVEQLDIFYTQWVPIPWSVSEVEVCAA